MPTHVVKQEVSNEKYDETSCRDVCLHVSDGSFCLEGTT